MMGPRISSITAFACALSLAFATQAGASRIAGAPTDFQDYLLSFDAVFIGRVDSVSVGPYSSALPCARGMGPWEAVRWVVRVEETIQGSGLHDREIVLGFAPGTPGWGFQSVVGSRVLAFGNRGCSYDWHVWGFALVLEGDSVLTDCSYFEGPERLDIRHPKASLWRLLRPLRERPRNLTAAVFDGFDGLGIVRASGRLSGANGTWEVSGRWIHSIKGSAPDDSVRLRFHPPPAGGAPVSPGDSLLVPWFGARPGRVLTFDLSPGVFQIEKGYVTSLGRSLDALPALIVQRDERYRIPPIVHP